LKILWLTSSPANASEEFGYDSFGVSWVSALQSLLEESKLYELRVCFFYDGDTFKSIRKNNVEYYGVPFRKGNAVKRILARHRARLLDEETGHIHEIIAEYKPDLIHVFGTENGYGKILRHQSEKVLFTLQGMAGAIADVYFPPGFNQRNVLKNSDLNSIIRGISIIHHYRILKKWANREQETMKYWKYFLGRTSFDRNFVGLLNPGARYFHFEDALRKDFFETQWVQPSELKGAEIVIGTTFSPDIYKGLDLVYKVMDLMKDYRIHWKIFGTSDKDTMNRVVKRVLKMDHKKLNIELCGQISANEIIKQLKTCHFYVHTSYIENSPNSVCEAMLLGMPVLASSVGGVKSIVENGKTGFLFNPYDKHDLAGLLVYLINNYGKAKEAGSKARQLALKRHSPDAIIAELNKIYNTIFSDHS